MTTGPGWGQELIVDDESQCCCGKELAQDDERDIPCGKELAKKVRK